MPNKVISLTYALNAGPAFPLNVGPGKLTGFKAGYHRLVSSGDFNIEIDHADLLSGENTVTLTATDEFSTTITKNVSLLYTKGVSPTLPYTIDWSKVITISDVAQVVDGLWTIEGNSIRPVETGYDRLVALGDMAWSNYEVTVPLTINQYKLNSTASGFALIGVIMRWQGHYQEKGANEQPRIGWMNAGALGIWQKGSEKDDYHLRIWCYGPGEDKVDPSGYKLQEGVSYIFKMRAESCAVKSGCYSLKVWEAGTPEPTDWLITYSSPSSRGNKNGSVVLVTHYADVSFGPVSVTPLP